MKIIANHFPVKCRITQVMCPCTTIMSPSLSVDMRICKANVKATRMP